MGVKEYKPTSAGRRFIRKPAVETIVERLPHVTLGAATRRDTEL
jgi:ribosomal protein L2